MALKSKKPTLVDKAHAWLDSHNAIACTGVTVMSVCAIFGLFLFVAFSGFGATADFIYNQF